MSNQNSESPVRIFPFPGTIPEGSHEPGHYYMEKEGYLPTMNVAKTPIDRYKKDDGDNVDETKNVKQILVSPKNLIHLPGHKPPPVPVLLR